MWGRNFDFSKLFFVLVFFNDAFVCLDKNAVNIIATCARKLVNRVSFDFNVSYSSC